MAGKQGMKGGGGARPGAGRKKETLSKSQVDEMLATAKRKAKGTGRTLDDILVDIIWNEETSVREVLAAIKLFKEFTMAKTSEQKITREEIIGPVIGLPETKSDPAKLVPIKGGKK